MAATPTTAAALSAPPSSEIQLAASSQGAVAPGAVAPQALPPSTPQAGVPQLPIPSEVVPPVTPASTGQVVSAPVIGPSEMPLSAAPPATPGSSTSTTANGPDNAQAPYAIPDQSAQAATEWALTTPNATASAAEGSGVPWSNATYPTHPTLASATPLSDNITASSDRDNTTQLSPSSIAAITVPLILVAAGLVLLAFLTVINRRKARRRRGSHSGPDLFDKDPSLCEKSDWRADPQSRWYALGLGLGDARASRQLGARRNSDAVQDQAAGRTPHIFVGPGRWVSGVGGGSLSSTSRSGRVDSDSNSNRMWHDPFKKHSDGVTVTIRQADGDEAADPVGSSSLGRDTTAPSQIAGQVARSVEQAAYGNSRPTVLQPSLLRSGTPPSVGGETNRITHAPTCANSYSADRCASDLSVSPKSVSAVGGHHLDHASEGRCLTSRRMTSDDTSVATIERPRDHDRHAVGNETLALDVAGSTMSRIRDWRHATSSDEVDHIASSHPSSCWPSYLDTSPPTPLVNEPSPTLSPLSTFTYDRLKSTPAVPSSRSLGMAGASQLASRQSFDTLASISGRSREARYAARSSPSLRAAGFMAEHSYPVSGPLSPSIATESIHPRRQALTASISSESSAPARPFNRYASSSNSKSFVTARSGPSNLSSDHPFVMAYPRPPLRSSTLQSTSSIDGQRDRFESISTIKPGPITPISAIPHRRSQPRPTGVNEEERFHGTPTRRSRLPSRTDLRRSSTPSGSGQFESELAGDRMLVREKTRKGAAWERLVLSGLG